MDRHPALRSTFHLVDGQPVIRVHERKSVYWETTDAAGWSDGEIEAELTQAANRPYDLDRDALMRLVLYVRSADEIYGVFSFHHIIADYWSLPLIMQEMATAYEALRLGEPYALLPVDEEAADYTRWQNEMLAGPRGERLREFWQSTLAGDLPALSIPIDFQRPAIQTFSGAQYYFEISAERTAGLQALANRQGVTLYSLMLAAYLVLLHRYSGQEDILVGAPMIDRSRRRFSEAVGYFINAVAQRGDLSGDPRFTELLDRIQAVVMAAVKHRSFPLERVIETLDVVAEPGRTPVYQTSFMLFAEPLEREGITGVPAFSLGYRDTVCRAGSLCMSAIPLSSRDSLLELSMGMSPVDDRLAAYLQYKTGIFSPETITWMADHFLNLLDQIILDPDQNISRLSLVTEMERRKIAAWSNREQALPFKPVHTAVDERARGSPAAPALRMVDQPGDGINFEEWRRRSNQVANVLAGEGIGPGVRVGVLARRSIDLAVTLLGILKTGAAYVPIEPSDPPARIRAILEDSAAALLVADGALPAGLVLNHPPVRDLAGILALASGQRAEDLLADLDEDSPMYLVYTSGSTGKPKGVLIRHASVSNHLQWLAADYPCLEGDLQAQKTRYTFVDFHAELFGGAYSGCPAVIFPDGLVADVSRFIESLRESGATRIRLTPSLLAVMLDLLEIRGEQLRSVRLWAASGEQITPDLVRRFYGSMPESVLVNIYGSSEVTADVLACELPFEVHRRRHTPVGEPIPNASVHILDAHLRHAPVGVPGELYVGGVMLAAGYTDAALTAERFIKDPFDGPGGRLYRTGDLCRRLPDGAIETLGRTDRQVKVRGFRVEPDEIEWALAGHPGVSMAAVVPHAASDQRSLAAFVVLHGGRETRREDLFEYLRTLLPVQMLPVSIEILEEMPLTAGGKVNRRALPEPGRAPDREIHVGPRNALELRLQSIWQDLLGRDPVGVTEPFFAVGGHSLAAVQLLAGIEKEFGKKIPVVALLNQGLDTIAGQAQLLASEGAGETVLVKIRSRAGGPALFIFPAGYGHSLAFAEVARRLEVDSPVYLLQPLPEHRGLDPGRLAQIYAEKIRETHPDGPIVLCGNSSAGLIAYATAAELSAGGRSGHSLILLDTPFRIVHPFLAGYRVLRPAIERTIGTVFRSRFRLLNIVHASTMDDGLEIYLHALQDYTPTGFSGRITLFLAKGSIIRWTNAAARWKRHARREIEIVQVAGAHHNFFREPHTGPLAEAITGVLNLGR